MRHYQQAQAGVNLSGSHNLPLPKLAFLDKVEVVVIVADVTYAIEYLGRFRCACRYEIGEWS